VGRPRRMLVTVAALFVLLPAAAQATTTTYKVYAPPGKAGTSEYSEVVATSGGGVAPPANLSDPSSKAIDSLGRAKHGLEKLAKLGKTGAAAANLARATAPARVTLQGPSAGTQAGATGNPGSTVDTGSAVSGLLHLVAGSDQGGIGVFMPLLLGLSAAGALGFALGRRFRPRQI
jgi:hypothetical protein